MYTFRDFLAVNYTGETEQQDLNAVKRHRMVGMWEDAAGVKKDINDPKTGTVDPNSGEKLMIVGNNMIDSEKKKKSE